MDVLDNALRSLEMRMHCTMSAYSILCDLKNHKRELKTDAEIFDLIYRLYVSLQNVTEIYNILKDYDIKCSALVRTPDGKKRILASDITDIIDKKEIDDKVLQNYTRVLYNKKRGYRENWNIKTENPLQKD